jgi:hypothetical protein
MNFIGSAQVMLGSADRFIMSKLNHTMMPLAFGLSVLTTACNMGSGFLKQSGPSEASARVVQVVVKDQNGTTSAAISRSSTLTQELGASPNSAVAGSRIQFPPGSLAVDTEVTIQAGASLATAAVFSQLSVTTEVASSATAVTFASSVPTDAVVPFRVAIPLPDSSSLYLSDPFANLIIVYSVSKASLGNGQFTGIIGRAAIDSSTGFARFAVNYFGTYQAVITKTLVQPVEVAAAPSLKVKRVIKPGVISDRFYYGRGPMPTSFGSDAPQSSGHFKGWAHAFGPSKVGTTSTLSTGKISKALPEKN